MLFRIAKKLSLVMLVLFVLGLLVLGYAHFIEPREFVVHQEILTVDHWSKNLDNFKIVAISDVHGGSYSIDEARIREVVDTANAQNPDLIVLLGDYVSQNGGKSAPLKMPSETVIENLKGLRAKYGVYAIIGNHDWWYDEKKMTAEFENAGIRVLENEIVPVSIGAETINLWGIEDYWKKAAVPLKPFETLPVKENVLAITHNPDSLFKAPAGIALMMAGHSHGGQINFPLYGRYPFVNDVRLMAGLAEIDGKKVFVTTGVGTSGPAFRFRVPPELAVLTLRSSEQ